MSGALLPSSSVGSLVSVLNLHMDVAFVQQYDTGATCNLHLEHEDSVLLNRFGHSSNKICENQDFTLCKLL